VAQALNRMIPEFKRVTWDLKDLSIKAQKLKKINNFHYESQISRVNTLFNGIIKDLQQTWQSQVQELQHNQKRNLEKIEKLQGLLKSMSESAAQKGAMLANQQFIFPYLKEEDGSKHLATFRQFLEEFERESEASSEFSVEFARFSRTKVSTAALFSKHHEHFRITSVPMVKLPEDLDQKGSPEISVIQNQTCYSFKDFSSIKLVLTKQDLETRNISSESSDLNDASQVSQKRIEVKLSRSRTCQEIKGNKEQGSQEFITGLIPSGEHKIKPSQKSPLSARGPRGMNLIEPEYSEANMKYKKVRKISKNSTREHESPVITSLTECLKSFPTGFNLKQDLSLDGSTSRRQDQSGSGLLAVSSTWVPSWKKQEIPHSLAISSILKNENQISTSRDILSQKRTETKSGSPRKNETFFVPEKKNNLPKNGQEKTTLQEAIRVQACKGPSSPGKQKRIFPMNHSQLNSNAVQTTKEGNKNWKMEETTQKRRILDKLTDKKAVTSRNSSRDKAGKREEALQTGDKKGAAEKRLNLLGKYVSLGKSLRQYESLNTPAGSEKRQISPRKLQNEKDDQKTHSSNTGTNTRAKPVPGKIIAPGGQVAHSSINLALENSLKGNQGLVLKQTTPPQNDIYLEYVGKKYSNLES
jgi:hypothetical protein